MSRRVLFSVVVAVLCAVSAGVAGEATEKQEAAGFEAASALLTGECYTSATAAFETFVHDHPESRLAPEALYKAGCAYVLHGDPEQAGKTFERLVQEHADSPWARVAASAHLNAEQVYKLAKEKQEKGREPGRTREAAAAVQLFQIYLSRFLHNGPHAPSTEPKEKIFYKMADCLRRSGNGDTSTEILKKLRDQDKDGDWGKLAAIRLGEAREFREGMDELIRLGTDGEEYVTFLELSETYFLSLNEQERVKCQLYRARCLSGLGKKAEALAVYQAILEEHPSSPYAAESAFWLAEKLFSDGEFDKARTAYRELARKYPQSPRAAQARRWARWLSDREASWKEAEQVVGGLLRYATEGKGGLAFTVKRTSDQARRPLEVRFACQGQHLFLSLAYGATGLLVANNSEGSWYRLLGEDGVCLKSGKPIEFPMPRARLDTKPDGEFSFGLGMGVGTEAPDAEVPILSVPPSAAADLVAKAKTWCHLGRVVRTNARGEKRVVLRFEQAGWDTGEQASAEVELDEGRAVCEVRYTTTNDKGEKTRWTMSDVAIGRPLPEEAFAVHVPAGVQVREVESINTMDVFPQFLKIAGTLVQDIAADYRKN